MVFGFRRHAAQDEDTPREEAGVPYRVASYEHDVEGKQFKSSDVVYSFWSAAKYTLILSIVLWWLPLFGQMIAGYVGGRRAGGPWKGVAASILPVVCLYIVVTGFDSGFFPSHVMGVTIAPAVLAASLGESIPLISPYIQFSSEYVGSFVDALAGSSPYGINTYIVTVAFAYVGGILAEQSRREIDYASGSVMSNTTVLMPNSHQNQAQRFHPYPEPSRPGLAHMIASHMPWSREYAEHHSHQHVYALPPAHRGGWEHATTASIRASAGHPGRAERFSDEDDDVEREVNRNRRKRQTKKSSKPRHRSRNDPWQRAERRVKQPYSSAKRFAPEHADSSAAPARRKRKKHSSASSRHSSSRYVPADARSVKRARKRIEREWNPHQHPSRPSSGGSSDFFEDEGSIVEDAAERAHGRSHHTVPRSKRWDTI